MRPVRLFRCIGCCTVYALTDADVAYMRRIGSIVNGEPTMLCNHHNRVLQEIHESATLGGYEVLDPNDARR